MEKLNKVLHKGGSFGELALKKGLSGQMRQATVVALEDCHFAILNKESYDVSLVYSSEFWAISTRQRWPIS